MKAPGVRSTTKDLKRNITFHVFAYRALTSEELTREVQAFLSQPHRPGLKDGQTYTIMTIIGVGE